MGSATSRPVVLIAPAPVVGGDVKTARTAIGTIDDFAQTTLPQLGKVVTTLTGASLSSGQRVFWSAV